MTVYFVDGQFVEKEHVSISVDDRGYYFGDGVYEVIKVYDGDLYTGEEHIARLFESAAKIKLTIPYSEAQLIEMAKQLVVSNSISVGHVYMQVTRGVAPRVHQFPNPAAAPMLTAYALDGARPTEEMQKGVKVKSVEDFRWLRCDIKSLNLLANVMAKQEAVESGCKEAVFVRDGYVTEGASTNMFGVRDGVLYTHPANNFILNGITRQVVLRLSRELGVAVREEPFTLEAALVMDELFMTSTTLEVMPIIQLDDKMIGSGRPGEITLQLQKAFASQISTVATGA
ncbi:D-alanine aminotransferase [Bacillus sp. OxB-1]|uniref:D-amino-acid transaminase n=1 Tax=Bacillus sp. (strain OxB-1) TaxID=98228 RepID=UPI00058215E4|nr:D-amino-acid transaminase [Bacillus sp. OxB-1]BAQ11800.1 D-alanine aminotransferase [Bacillus sp. OxB-1]